MNPGFDVLRNGDWLSGERASPSMPESAIHPLRIADPVVDGRSGRGRSQSGLPADARTDDWRLLPLACPAALVNSVTAGARVGRAASAACR